MADSPTARIEREAEEAIPIAAATNASNINGSIQALRRLQSDIAGAVNTLGKGASSVAQNLANGVGNIIKEIQQAAAIRAAQEEKDKEQIEIAQRLMMEEKSYSSVFKEHELLGYLEERGLLTAEAKKMAEDIHAEVKRNPNKKFMVASYDAKGNVTGQEEVTGKELLDSVALVELYMRKDEISRDGKSVLNEQDRAKLNMMLYGHEDGPRNEEERLAGLEKVQKAQQRAWAYAAMHSVHPDAHADKKHEVQQNVNKNVKKQAEHLKNTGEFENKSVLPEAVSSAPHISMNPAVLKQAHFAMIRGAELPLVKETPVKDPNITLVDAGEFLNSYKGYAGTAIPNRPAPAAKTATLSA